MKSKFIKVAIISIFGLAAFALTANAATENIPSYTRWCDVHGPTRTCNTMVNFNGSRSDYSVVNLNWSLTGHRHGASQIDGAVCIDSDKAAPVCQYGGCSGSVCGTESPPPTAQYPIQSSSFGDGMVGGEDHFTVTTWIYVDDAEGWLTYSGSATYPDNDPDPGGGGGGGSAATVACVISNSSGTRLSGANCTFNGNSGSTNAQGYYAFNNVPIPGTYTLGVSKSGYNSYSGSYGISGNTDLAITLTTSAPAGQYALGVSKSGSGSGTVTGTGISCGSDCTQNFNSGTVVTLTATPAGGSTFAGWSGTGCTSGTVTMNANRNCVATFNSGMSACADNANDFYSTSFPATVTPGQTVPFTVNATNNGTSYWYHGDVYSLRQVSAFQIAGTSAGQEGLTYGHIGGNWCTGLTPGGTCTWNFNLTAPSTPGTYTLDMRMFHTPGYGYKLPSSAVCAGTNPDYFGTSASATFTVVDPTPTVDSVTISSPIVNANNSTQYTISITGNTQAGGDSLHYQYAMINYPGTNSTNAGQYRGFLTWALGNHWPAGKNNMACSGGGYAVIQNAAVGNGIYGDQYMNMDSCSTSVSGNMRTTNFVVRFDPIFTSPLTLNDIAGIVYHSNTAYTSGWVNFDINFALGTMPALSSVTIAPQPVSADNSTNYNITVTGSDTAGGGNISHEYAIINTQRNGAAFNADPSIVRGFVHWYYDSTYVGWNTYKNKMSCTGGGIAAVNISYGTQYISLVGCNTTVSGNTRTTVFTVRFDPSFIAPATDNDISGYIHNLAGNTPGYVNFNTNFNLVAPQVTNVSISSPTVVANNSTAYDIVVVGTNPSGGANIVHEYAMVNYGGTNAGQYRGYLTWAITDSWPTGKNHMACSGGGWAVIQSNASTPNHDIYGPQYMNMNSCSTYVSGNTRTVAFNVRFDPIFTTPTTLNDIAGWLMNTYGVIPGWTNFDINFALQTFDYNLSNSGNSTVAKGASNVTVQNTITKTLVFGTTQPVTVSVSGLPTGVTAAISNNPCSPTCSSVITFTVAPTTIVGTYPITVTGNLLGKSTTFNLIVNAPVFDYTLSNSGNSSVTKSSSNVTVTNTITKTLTAGTSQAVTVSLSALPSGVTAAISNNPCSPTCSSVITFTVAPTTVAGTYPITVSGNLLGKTTGFSLIVADAAFDYSLSNSGNTTIQKSTVNVTGNNTITKTLVAGATQGVTVSLSALPAGVSASIASNPCSPTCSSIITFTVTPSATEGTFPITVTGVPLNRTTSFNLIVTAAAVNGVCAATHYNCTAGGPSTLNVDGPTQWSWTCPGSGGGSPASCSELKPVVYTLSASPNPLNITKGSANVFGQTNIQKNLISGAPQPVTLTLTGVPAGVTYSISNSACAPTCTSTITFTIPPTAPVGNHTITVTGSPGNVQTTFTLALSGNPSFITCSASASTVFIGQNVTWTASVSGGRSPYTYVWTGTNINPPVTIGPIPSSSGTYTKSYSTTGQKNAVATVTDADDVVASCPATSFVNVIVDPDLEEF